MKKILFILHLPPPVHGPAVVGKCIRGSALVNRQFETCYINLSTSRNIREVGKASLRKVTDMVRLRQQVRRTLSDFRPDLVYVTAAAKGLGFLKDATLLRMIKRLGYPVVVHFHNKGVAEAHGKLLQAMYRDFFKGIKVILLSERLYPDISAYVPRQDVYFCANGTSDPGLLPRIQSSVPHLLFLSNLVESKGILVLLDACKVLKDRGLRFVLDIMGGPSAEISPERLQAESAARGLADLVICHGPVFGEEKEKIFRGADIFVHPTYEDCFPLVVLEAMARALPVVATDEGALPEMVADGESGLIVPRKEPYALAGALEKLLADPALRTSMGAAGRARYEQLYTEEAFLRRFVEILQQL